MRILIVWGADYPWDIRIEKFFRSLYLDGHQVHLLCRNLEKLPKNQRCEYGHIHRLTPFKNSRLNYYASFPVFLNPFWLKASLKIIKEEAIDLAIVRDLPLALSTYIAGRLAGCPVVMDMAENYVALLEDTWRYEPFHFINIFVRNPIIAHWVEKLTIRWLDHILVVVEEMKQRLISEGANPLKIDIVSNTPDIDFFNNLSVQLTDSEIELLENRYIIIYVGGLEYSRGLEQVVRSMPNVINKIPESLFLVIGEGNSKNRLENIARELGISEHVWLRGWVDFKYIPLYLAKASVGIIPHHVTNHTNYTIPNKLFDYMYYGLPIVASSCRPIVRILQEEGCGLTFSNTEQLSKCLLELADFDLRKAMGLRAHHSIESRYNWENDASTLNLTVKRLTQK